ncbi:PKD domain-containing protein [Winogradskyella alexanderae]|uniref:PKD domain-containing protein n=1 Tax=Winogradskyella alexanderae TaxID=2877123 RepID=A0ABS7XWV3_9FLAO|nr:PKD domain-containing protein [Winogradskyella alexanderae]MCA0133372.1 PKD domain-containing protein [Winogradskyella alexanderae]
MKKPIQGLRIMTLLLFVLTYWGCEDDDMVKPVLEAKFTHTINQDTGTVSFINVSSNASSFTWDFGDGTSSTIINPEKTYVTGTYTITLTAKNSDGDTDTFDDTITIQIPEEVEVPITFDNPLVDYNVGTFNGASFAIVENPDPSGANPDVSNVGALTNIGAAFEGFFFDLGMPLDLTTDKSIKMKFWATAPIDILLKLEEGTLPAIETVASHSGTGWEEIYFSFDSAASYSRLTLFVDGPGTTSGTFYLDDIEQINTADVPCQLVNLELPIDFDCDSIDYANKIVGNVSFTIIENPEQSGINPDATMVGQITNAGLEFENAFFNFDVPVDFSTLQGVRLKLFSNQALPILLKFEDGTAADTEDIQMHGGTGWEELTFTFNSSGSYNDMVLFVDGPGTASGVFYVDDFEQVQGATPPPPFDDGLLTNGDFQTLDMNGNTVAWIQGINDLEPAPIVTVSGNTYYSIPIEFPDPNGNAFTINVSQKLPLTGAETYELTFDAWTDATTGSRSIVAGIGLSGGTFASNTQAVNISSTPTTYQLTLVATDPNSGEDINAPDARVLFDLAAEAGEVNIDNVSLFVQGSGGGGGGGCSGDVVAATTFPVDFEGCESFIESFSSIGPDGVIPSLVANPNPSGINTSDNVLQVVKQANINRWGGIQNPFPAGVIDITTNTFKIKVYSSVPDVTYRFELALVPQTTPVTGNPAPQFRQVSGGANEWVELEFTFENLPASPTTYNQLVIKPDNPNGSDGDLTTEERVFYFDDLRLD